MRRNHLFCTAKADYVRGKKPDVPCILCALRDGHPEVPDLVVWREELMIAALNLYPYNPGHLMIFPVRHCEFPSELDDAEALALHRLTVRAMDILGRHFSPVGYNVGFNLGQCSGASIPHMHQHIVPRYENETGFIDVMCGERIVVVDPLKVLDELRTAFANE